MKTTVRLGEIRFGGHPFVLIAGPCVIENQALTLRIARRLREISRRLKLPLVFKASYDKANRTSPSSFRGPGQEEGLAILNEVKEQLGLPVLSDVHCTDEVEAAARVLDIIQIPAFLCRQTDLIVAAARTGRIVNVKKGQFLAPWDMQAVVKKIEAGGNRRIILTERGTTFGYNNLVVDFRSLAIMRRTGYPVCFDASHSVQHPGGLGNATGGDSEFIPLLARAGVAAGCDAVFMEVHPNPAKALSDGPNLLALDRLEPLLADLLAIDGVGKR